MNKLELQINARIADSLLLEQCYPAMEAMLKRRVIEFIHDFDSSAKVESVRVCLLNPEGLENLIQLKLEGLLPKGEWHSHEMSDLRQKEN
jgi:hypothetical protein